MACAVAAGKGASLPSVLHDLLSHNILDLNGYGVIIIILGHQRPWLRSTALANLKVLWRRLARLLIACTVYSVMNLLRTAKSKRRAPLSGTSVNDWLVEVPVLLPGPTLAWLEAAHRAWQGSSVYDPRHSAAQIWLVSSSTRPSTGSHEHMITRGACYVHTRGLACCLYKMHVVGSMGIHGSVLSGSQCGTVECTRYPELCLLVRASEIMRTFRRLLSEPAMLWHALFAHRCASPCEQRNAEVIASTSQVRAQYSPDS